MATFTHAEAEKIYSTLVELLTAFRAHRHAIRTTAAQGGYDEIAIRKAVSFELAEMIADERKLISKVNS